MIVVTRIPTHRNDGTEISARELGQILAKVRDKFRGYSLEGPSWGAWVAANGDIYEEDSWKLEVVVPPERVNAVRKMYVRIGKRLGQRALFYEVREGGEIIDLDEE